MGIRNPFHLTGNVIEHAAGSALHSIFHNRRKNNAPNRRSRNTYGNPNTSFAGRQGGVKYRNAPNGNVRSGPTHKEGKSIASSYDPGTHRGRIKDIHETPQFRAQTTAPSKPKRAVDRSADSIIAAILAAARPPSGGGAGVPQIDIGSVTHPFDQAVQAANATAMKHQVLLDQYQARGAQEAKQYGIDTQAQVARQQAAQNAAARASVAESQAQGKQNIAQLQAQGVDPMFIAQAQKEAQSNTGSRQAANQAVAGDLATQKAIAAEDARSRAMDNQDIGLSAKDALSNTLLSTVLDLNTQKAQAQAQAEQQNQQAAAAAASQNSDLQRQYMQSLAQILGTAQSSIADAQGDPTAFETPGRAGVQHWIDNYDKSHGGRGYADDIIKYATQGEDEQHALKLMDQAIKDKNAELKAKNKQNPNFNGVNFDTEYMRKIIHDWYRTSNQLRQSKYDQIMSAAQLQARLLGYMS